MTLRLASHARDTGPAHQHPDRAVTDTHAVAENQLGVHPSCAVDTAQVDMHLTDKAGQPLMPDRAIARSAVCGRGRTSMSDAGVGPPATQLVYPLLESELITRATQVVAQVPRRPIKALPDVDERKRDNPQPTEERN